MGVDLDAVWNVIENDLPQLKKTVQAMREDVDRAPPQEEK
jgi:uncharacterized protein with HEPN domain